MAAKKKLLVLVDGSSYLFRAYHALPPLTNAHGEPTGAMYGVVNMLVKLVDEYQPDRVAVVFDAGAKTFRNDIYPEYKTNREAMPDELRAQIEPIHDIVRSLGFPLIAVPNVEADDVIGTLARQADASGMRVVISTSDKDIAQLVNENISLVNTMSAKKLNIEGVKEKFGVLPEQMIDYLSLIGDTSDNIPGIPKVGPKTAAKWLAQYQTLEAIVEHAEDIKGKVGESFREHIDRLPLAKDLVTIRCELELDDTPDALRAKAVNAEKLSELYTRYELRSLAKDLPIELPPEAGDSVGDIDYEMVTTKNKFSTWLKKIKASDKFAFDTETTSLDYMQADIVGLSFAVDSTAAAYVPLAHDYAAAPKQLDRKEVLDLLAPILADNSKAKIGHHLKYDAHVLKRAGYELNGIHYDTMMESFVFNSTATRHDMDSVAKRYLDFDTVHYEDVAGKGAKQIPFSQVSVEDATRYAAEDAAVTYALHEAIWPKLSMQPAVKKVYCDIERPLIPVLQKMEYGGVLIDADLLLIQSREIEERVRELEDEMQVMAGAAFNPNSTKQLREILFEKLEIPVVRKTPKGQASTAEDVLQELAHDYELPEKILEYRSLSKLKSTYTDKLPLQIDKDSGRVHTSYHQAGAATGRLSSSDPNLQNIPIRTAEGRRIRQAFIAPAGKKILAADYSQIELRIMAHLSGDKGLIQAFKEEKDIHSATASEVFGVALDKVDKNERRKAKAINFGLIYGMSAFGLAKQIDVTRKEAQAYIDTYFERYPGVRAFMDNTRESARELGFVETIFGRRLYLNEIKSRNAQRRQYAERAAINAPMQGTAADIIKRAMITIDDWISSEKTPQARLTMQVHDELVFEVVNKSVKAVSSKVEALMCGAADLDVPLKVDIGHGDNWDEAH